MLWSHAVLTDRQCACARASRIDFATPWQAETENAYSVRVQSACAGCGAIFEPLAAGRLDSSHRAQLSAARRVGAAGTWNSLGLPSLRRIGVDVGDASLIATVPKSQRFFKYDWDRLADGDLFGAVRSRLGLGRSFWPRAVVTPAWTRPVIIHHGLAEKFTSKRDNAHLHIVSLAERTIRLPAEGWIAEYRGSPNLHLLARYRIGRIVIDQMACIDTETAICTTVYHLDPAAADRKRAGLFHYARWVAPI